MYLMCRPRHATGNDRTVSTWRKSRPVNPGGEPPLFRRCKADLGSCFGGIPSGALSHCESVDAAPRQSDPETE